MAVCEFCKRDWNDIEQRYAHRAACLGAAMSVTAGGEYPHPPGTVVQPYKDYRPKRRKKSSFEKKRPG